MESKNCEVDPDSVTGSLRVKSHRSLVDGSVFLHFSNYSVDVIKRVFDSMGIEVDKKSLKDTLIGRLEKMVEKDEEYVTKHLSLALGLGKTISTRSSKDSITNIGINGADSKAKDAPHWKNGGLSEWEKWRVIFEDVAKENRYTDSSVETRLRRLTQDSDDYPFIEVYMKTFGWMAALDKVSELKRKAKKGDKKQTLRDVKQGKGTVLAYLSKFLMNKKEIEQSESIIYSEGEVIRAFEDGLWNAIISRLNITNLTVRRCSLINFSEDLIAVEAEVRREINTRRQNRQDTPTNTLLNTGDIEDKGGICWFWRKYSKCKFGKNCYYKNDHKANTKGVQAIERSVPETDDEEKSFSAVSLVSAGDQELTDVIFLDSACSLSETNRMDYFVAYEEYSKCKGTQGIGGAVVEIIGWGIIAMRCRVSGNLLYLRTEYAPELGHTLVSQGQLDRKGVEHKGSSGVSRFYRPKGRKLIFEAVLSDKFYNLYQLNVDVVKDVDKKHVQSLMAKERKRISLVNGLTFKSVLMDRHAELNHLNVGYIMDMVNEHDTLNELKEIPSKEIKEFRCATCLDMKPLPWARSLSSANKHVEDVNICTDYKGPLVTSRMGNKYLKVTFVKRIGYIFSKALKSRSGSSAAKDTDRVLKVLEDYGWRVLEQETDDAKELVGKKMKNVLSKYGTRSNRSVGYDSNSNPYAERSIRTIMEPIACVLRHTRVPVVLWDLASSMVTFINNRIIRSHKGSKIIPEELLTGRKSNLPRHLYIFGSLAWAWKHGDDSGRKSNLKQRNTEAMYIGPGEMRGIKGALFLDLDLYQNGKDVEDCVFASRRYKIYNGVSCKLPDTYSSMIWDDSSYNQSEDYVPESPDQGNGESDLVEHDEKGNDKILKWGNAENTQAVDNEVPRRSERVRKKRSFELGDFGMLSVGDVTQMMSLAGIIVNVKKAEKSEEWPEWQEAIQKENSAFSKYNVYEVISQEELDEVKKDGPLAGGRVFSTRYVLEDKGDRKKARLVVQTYDYVKGGEDVSSPVVKKDTLFMMLNIVVSLDWELEQYDVSNAFLQSSLLGRRCVVKSPDKKELWLLLKAVYGHPEASKAWYLEVGRVFATNGKWVVTKAFDRCCYIRKENGLMIGMVILHVDDFLAGGIQGALDELRDILFSNFDMKRVYDNKYIGIRWSRNRETGKLFLDMEEYIDKLSKKVFQDNIQRDSMPYCEKDVMGMRPGGMNGKDLRKINGALIFVTCVRPDIVYITSVLCQYNDCYTNAMVEQCKRVVGYLYHTKGYKLEIRSSDLKLNGWFDSGFANETGMKSRNGLVYRLGDSFLQAESKKDTINVDSSTYAEVRALLAGVKGMEYYRSVLGVLGFVQGVSTVYQDNTGAIKIGVKGTLENRSRHFGISYHYIEDRISRGKIKLEYKKTGEMIADMLTKPLGRNKFMQFRWDMGVKNFTARGMRNTMEIV